MKGYEKYERYKFRPIKPNEAFKIPKPDASPVYNPIKEKLKKGWNFVRAIWVIILFIIIALAYFYLIKKYPVG